MHVEFKFLVDPFGIQLTDNQPFAINLGGEERVTLTIERYEKQVNAIQVTTRADFPIADETVEALKKLPPHLPLNECNKNIQETVRRIESRIRNVSFQTIRLLRWIYDIGGVHSPFGVIHHKWSDDNVTWYQFPTQYTVTELYGINQIKVADISSEQIAQMVHDRIDEPVAHSLYLEAERNLGNNNRSCLVLAVAAAETAIKSVVIHFLPQSEWLVKNVPSPPIVKLYKKYLPKILPIGEQNFLSKDKLKILEEAVKKRNELVHGRDTDVHTHDLLPMLKTVKCLLWLCDYYNGNKWALRFSKEG